MLCPVEARPRRHLLPRHHFRKWTAEGLIEEMHELLHSMCRKQVGREEIPSLGLIDSQSAKTSSMTTEKGYWG